MINFKKKQEGTEKLLQERNDTHGNFDECAYVGQMLLHIIRDNGRNYKRLTMVQREAIHMIFHKIARMVCGDPQFLDHSADIEGYAKLLHNDLKERCNVPE